MADTAEPGSRGSFATSSISGAHGGEFDVAESHNLERANAALREGLAFVAAGDDIDAFLRRQIRVIADQFGSTSAGLWIEDSQTATTRLILSLENGRVVDAAESRHPFAGKPQTKHFGHAESDRFNICHEPLYWPTDIYRDPAQPFFDPDAATALEAEGIRALLILPLVAGGKLIGTLSHRLPSRDPIPAAKLELAQALANQAALALHLSRLADVERETAVAREREAAATARAEVLARANHALSRAAAMLSVKRDLDAYLGDLLLILLEQLESDSGSLWLIDAQGWFHLHTEVQDGRLLPLESSAHPGARAPLGTRTGSFPAALATFHAEQSGRALYYEDIATAPEYDGEEQSRAYLLGLGVRSQLIVPMFAGERRIGSFSVRSSVKRRWSADQLELAEALACQASLAIEMDRLAAQAREAALAREREAAERARAEKLAAANALLRESAERLGEIEDIDAFLGQVLLTITDILSARSATVWTEDRAARVTHLRYVVEDGKAIPPRESGHPNAHQPHAIPAPHLDPLRDRHTHLAKTLIIPIDEMLSPDSTKDYLRRLGAKALLTAPMVLAGVHLGTFTVRLDNDRPILDDDRELIQALANQAAVALHLALLAQEARAAAIAREREEAAARRAEVLARANAALRQSLDRFSQSESLDAFLGEVVQVCAAELEAAGVGIWMRLPDEELHTLLVSFEDGEVRSSGTYENPGLSSRSAPTPSLARGEIEFSFGEALRSRAWYPDFRDYLEPRGIIGIASVPLFVGPQWVGTIVLRFTHEPDFSREWRELAHALGSQVALVLELTRLAEEGRNAALVAERNRLAREIHDTLAQGFAAIRLQLTLSAEAAPGSPEAIAALVLAHQIASENLVEARRSMTLLKVGAMLFADELRAVIASVRRLGSQHITAQLDPQPIALPAHVSHELSRVAQEALVNAVQHAAANEIKIVLQAIPGGVRISVSDDGKGFDSARMGQGFGLDGLRDRCATIKAELSIVSEPGRGTEVIATWTAPLGAVGSSGDVA